MDSHQSDGCTSVVSAEAVINTPPVIPTAPTVGTIIQPACGETTGSGPWADFHLRKLDPYKNSGWKHHHRYRDNCHRKRTFHRNLYLDSYQCSRLHLRILHACRDQHPAGHPNGAHGGDHHPAACGETTGSVPL